MRVSIALGFGNFAHSLPRIESREPDSHTSEAQASEPHTALVRFRISALKAKEPQKVLSARTPFLKTAGFRAGLLSLRALGGVRLPEGQTELFEGQSEDNRQSPLPQSSDFLQDPGAATHVHPLSLSRFFARVKEEEATLSLSLSLPPLLFLNIEVGKLHCNAARWAPASPPPWF